VVRVRARPGVTELFVPMYLGLILLWPVVWSGDRFALPLIPILLCYTGERLLELAAPLQPVARRVALTAAVAVIALPSLRSWTREIAVEYRCNQFVRAQGSFACWGAPTQEYVAAATWSGANLPDGAIVLSRNPRVFYVMSGVVSEVFPFTQDVDRFLAGADSIGAGYVVLDYMDRTASMYVGNAVYRRSGTFCVLQQFGAGTGGVPPAQILGILPPDRRGAGASPEASASGEVSVVLGACSPELARATPLAQVSVLTQEIPLLVGFGSP
jgi:hypothetical protein